MNQVARTFILVGIVVVALLALHYLPPLHIGDIELRHVNILNDLTSEADEVYSDEEIFPKTPTDSVIVSDTVFVDDSVAYEKPIIPQGVTMITDYGQDVAGGMNHFYQQLLRVNELGRPVRIAYFGDSFIEGDILTCDLREQLQTLYGGQGVGWVDCASQVYGFRQTVSHSFSGIREYEVVKKPFNSRLQGIAQRYFVAEDSVTSCLSFHGVTARMHLDQWQRASLFFRTDGGFSLTTRINRDTTIYEQVSGSPKLQVLTKCYASMNRISYIVSRTSSHTILYGVALESSTGVIVDNFSMRGSSGVTLGSIPSATLQSFAAQRPYDLLVFHFGLNVASAKSQADNYKAYTHQMGEAIRHIRQAYPKASVLIVSVSDRDQRTSSGIHTMLGVESLVAHQQIMAADQQVAFFNLFQAMGGRESMKLLVDDGLANKDYTHLTFAGGRRLATKLVESIQAGVDNYKRLHP